MNANVIYEVYVEDDMFLKYYANKDKALQIKKDLEKEYEGSCLHVGMREIQVEE